MTDEAEELAIYDESGYPNVHYSKDEPSLVQAVGTLIAQIGKVHPNHPVIPAAIAFLEGLKPPPLKAIRGGKD
jgi:hypothetical protein